MKVVRRFCAFLVGVVFFVAGLLKLMDPVGAGLVVQEYFKFLHILFMMPLAKATAVGMALLETLLGAAMMTGMWPRLTGLITGIVMGGFTLLTLALWIYNPPMDCGCFGEVVHLTHAQSLIKNLILLFLWGVAYIPLSKAPTTRKAKHVAFWIATISVIIFMIVSLRTIPAMDFTSFKPGETLMQAQYGAAPDSPLLSICNEDGDYCDDLLSKGPVLLFSKYDPEEVSVHAEDRIRSLRDGLDSLGVASIVVVSGGDIAPGEYTSDRRVLMTVNRSNGGATLFSDGLIVAKWANTRLPKASYVASLAKDDATEAMMKENAPKRMKLQGFLLYVFAVLLVL